MAVSKVILNGSTLMDVTVDTVTSDKLLSGYQATGRDGQKVQGAYVPSSASFTTGNAVPSESSQRITPPSGYDGFTYVDIGAIDSNYVGSNIPTRGSNNLSASGSIVTVPSGYYSNELTKSVEAGSASTPATTITITPTISVSDAGLITAVASNSQSITPSVTSGYISSGVAGIIDIDGSNTSQLTTQAAATIVPTENEQTAVDSGKFTTGIVKVAAIPSSYIVPTGNITIYQNGDNIDVSQYATASVGVSTAEVVVVTISSLSSLPQTIESSYITADHVLLHYYMSMRGYQTDQWTVTTSNGSVTISGTISNSMNLTLILGKANAFIT